MAGADAILYQSSFINHSRPLNNAGNGGRIRGPGRARFDVLFRRVGRPPRDLVHGHIGADAFEFGGWLDNTTRGQRWIEPGHFLVSRFADEDAAPAGKAFEPAGEVYFTAKHGVVNLASRLE